MCPLKRGVRARCVLKILPLSPGPGMDRSLWYNRTAFPSPEFPLPAFRPFEGARYDCDVAGGELHDLVAPPYDVVDDDEHAALEALHDCNSVRLILPR